jgi:hypothetical protein
METEGSLYCPQKNVTGSYPESVKSNPRIITPYL